LAQERAARALIANGAEKADAQRRLCDWEPRNGKRGRRNKTEQTNPAAVQGRREDKRRHRLAAAGGTRTRQQAPAGWH